MLATWLHANFVVSKSKTHVIVMSTSLYGYAIYIVKFQHEKHDKIKNNISMSVNFDFPVSTRCHLVRYTAVEQQF